jgi:hypothetical protein
MAMKVTFTTILIALAWNVALATEESCAVAGNCPESVDFEMDGGLALIQKKALKLNAMKTHDKDRVGAKSVWRRPAMKRIGWPVKMKKAMSKAKAGQMKPRLTQAWKALVKKDPTKHGLQLYINKQAPNDGPPPECVDCAKKECKACADIKPPQEPSEDCKTCALSKCPSCGPGEGPCTGQEDAVKQAMEKRDTSGLSNKCSHCITTKDNNGCGLDFEKMGPPPGPCAGMEDAVKQAMEKHDTRQAMEASLPKACGECLQKPDNHGCGLAPPQEADNAFAENAVDAMAAEGAVNAEKAANAINAKKAKHADNAEKAKFAENAYEAENAINAESAQFNCAALPGDAVCRKLASLASGDAPMDDDDDDDDDDAPMDDDDDGKDQNNGPPPGNMSSSDDDDDNRRSDDDDDDDHNNPGAMCMDPGDAPIAHFATHTKCAKSAVNAKFAQGAVNAEQALLAEWATEAMYATNARQAKYALNARQAKYALNVGPPADDDDDDNGMPPADANMTDGPPAGPPADGPSAGLQ